MVKKFAVFSSCARSSNIRGMLINQKYSPGRESSEIVYGALDLGTNNCRLLMAVPAGAGFQVVDAFSRMTRLGEGLGNGNLLSPAAIDRTLAALKFCADKLQRRQVRRVRAVATEACRRASNCHDFLSQVKAETGLTLEIISSHEEACLAMAGCAPLLNEQPDDALVFDIGGGSTELIRVYGCSNQRRILQVLSLPLGVVTMAERFADSLYDPDGYQRVVASAAEQLRGFDADHSLSRMAESGRLQMLGTSGTVTTLAGIYLELARYDRAQVDGLTMTFAAIEAVSGKLLRSSFEQRAHHPCIGRERADLVVAGCAILAAICRLWPTGQLRVADRGVREGILLSLMRADRAEVLA
jgi:exopolyphosphatase/guanosine-5'-triphosphate,3'-diphosphate pyrophosphatase